MTKGGEQPKKKGPLGGRSALTLAPPPSIKQE